jgi:hypothetical protein
MRSIINPGVIKIQKGPCILVFCFGGKTLQANRNFPSPNSGIRIRNPCPDDGLSPLGPLIMQATRLRHCKSARQTTVNAEQDKKFSIA